jgi:hypothetical protein
VFRVEVDNSAYRKYALFVRLCREEKAQAYVKWIYHSLSGTRCRPWTTSELPTIRPEPWHRLAGRFGLLWIQRVSSLPAK